MNYSSWPKWIGLLQAPGAASSPQRLKGHILTIVWVKPAQKGLKLCFTCKASHVQNFCTKQIPLVSSTRSATCGGCLVGIYKWNSDGWTLFFHPQDKISITKGALSEKEDTFLSYISTIHARLASKLCSRIEFLCPQTLCVFCIDQVDGSEVLLYCSQYFLSGTWPKKASLS